MDDKAIIKEKFESSPKEIQEYLSNREWEKTINDITAIEGLNVEQKQSLQNELLFIMLGLDLPKNLIKNLFTELQIDSVRAENISKILNEKIIKPLEIFLPIEETEKAQGQSEDPSETKTDEWKRPQLASIPNYSDYEQGKDPYREPLE